ncbi:MAG: hypothetical protein ACI8PB_001501 [Desulforhopalus sp.]
MATVGVKKEGKVVFCEVSCVWYSLNTQAVEQGIDNSNALMASFVGALTYWTKNDNYRNEKK